MKQSISYVLQGALLIVVFVAVGLTSSTLTTPSMSIVSAPKSPVATTLSGGVRAGFELAQTPDHTAPQSYQNPSSQDQPTPDDGGILAAMFSSAGSQEDTSPSYSAPDSSTPDSQNYGSQNTYYADTTPSPYNSDQTVTPSAYSTAEDQNYQVEPLSDTTTRSTLGNVYSDDSIINTVISNGLNNNKPLASTDTDTRLTTLCQTYATLCGKETLKGTISNPDRLLITATFIWLVTHIDNAVTTSRKIQSTLSSFVVTDGSTEPCKDNARACANGQDLYINYKLVSSPRELISVIAHELGHVVDIGLVQGSASSMDPDFSINGDKIATDDPSLSYYRLGWTNTTTSTNNTLDFCSSYGKSNPYEDFAECFNRYLTEHEFFVRATATSAILRQKYNYIDRLMGGTHLLDTLHITNQESSYRPRDTTIE